MGAFGARVQLHRRAFHSLCSSRKVVCLPVALVFRNRHVGIDFFPIFPQLLRGLVAEVYRVEDGTVELGVPVGQVLQLLGDGFLVLYRVDMDEVGGAVNAAGSHDIFC